MADDDPVDDARLTAAMRRRISPPSTLASEAPGKLARHPYVKQLLRELAVLRDANAALAALQSAMAFQADEAAKHLEPLNPAAPGTIIPVVGFPTIVHVDLMRLRVNRVTGRRDPVIRILVGGTDTTDIRHAREVRLRGDSLLSEHYFDPLPGRKTAVVTLSTWEPVEVIR